MNYIEKLDKLIQLEKKSKLSIERSNEATKLLSEYIYLKEIKEKYKYVTDFNSDIGIEVFVQYLKTLSLEDQVLEINSLFMYEGFTINTSYKSTRRGLDLVISLNNQGFNNGIVLDTIVKVCNLTLKSSKTKINKTIIDAMRNMFFPMIKDNFYENIKTISQKDFYNVERIFVNTTFNDGLAKQNVNSKTKILVLKWLSKFKSVCSIEENEIDFFVKSILNMEEEFNEVIKEDREVMDKYGRYIGEDIILKENKNEKVNGKKEERIADVKFLSFEEISGNLNEIAKSLNILEKEKKKNIGDLKYYSSEYEKVKLSRDSLSKKLNDSQEYIKSISSKNEILEMELKSLKDKIESKNEEIKNSKQSISELANINSNLENVELKQFKNKLSSLLIKEFKDIKDLEGISPNINSINFINQKIKDIIKTLKNNDIDL